jgi:hypothetical protein
MHEEVVAYVPMQQQPQPLQPQYDQLQYMQSAQPQQHAQHPQRYAQPEPQPHEQQQQYPPQQYPQQHPPLQSVSLSFGDTQGRLREMFDRADRSSNQQVTKRELILALRKDAALCEELGLPSRIHQEGASRQAFERFFQTADADHDESISWKEFKAMHELHHMNAVSGAIAWDNHATSSHSDPTVSTVEVRDMGGGRLRYGI